MSDYENRGLAREFLTELKAWHQSYRERTIAEQAKAKALQEIANRQ